MIDPSRQDLLDVLRAARDLLALPGNHFDWSWWQDADAALREVDALIARLEGGRLPSQSAVSILFAPTGPIQEVSLSSGWSNVFLTFANRFDRAADRAYAGPL